MPTPRKHANAAARQAAFRVRRERARKEDLKEKGLPPLPRLSTVPGNARWTKILERAAVLLSTVVDERDAYRDDRSEAWQESERAETFQEITDAISAIFDDVDGIDLSTR